MTTTTRTDHVAAATTSLDDDRDGKAIARAAEWVDDCD